MPKIQYNFRIDPSLLEKIKAKAKEDRRSVNASIELAIEQYCKASGR